MKAFSKLFLVLILILGLVCTVVACADDTTDDPANSVEQSGDNGEETEKGGIIDKIEDFIQDIINPGENDNNDNNDNNDSSDGENDSNLGVENVATGDYGELIGVK